MSRVPLEDPKLSCPRCGEPLTKERREGVVQHYRCKYGHETSRRTGICHCGEPLQCGVDDEGQARLVCFFGHITAI